MLKIGSTWRTKAGRVVTVVGERAGQNFYVQSEANKAIAYTVSKHGTSVKRHDSYSLDNELTSVFIAWENKYNQASIDTCYEYMRRGCFITNLPNHADAGEPALRDFLRQQIPLVLTAEILVIQHSGTPTETLYECIARTMGITISSHI